MITPVITPDQLEIFKSRWLPNDASTNGWDDDKITDEWTGYFVTTVRAYWYDRVQQTAKYLDLPDPGGTLAITQIHRQAKEMLDYWDAYIKSYGVAEQPNVATTFGRIKRRYKRKGGLPQPIPNYYSPYQQLD